MKPALATAALRLPAALLPPPPVAGAPPTCGGRSRAYPAANASFAAAPALALHLFVKKKQSGAAARVGRVRGKST